MGRLKYLRWWHWMAVSLLVGAGIGYVSSSTIEPLTAQRTISSADFERLLMTPPIVDYAKKFPWVSDIVVYPAITIQGREQSARNQWVTFKAILINGQNSEIAPCSMIAPVPYEPAPPINAAKDQLYPGMTLYQAQDGDTVQSVAAKYYGKSSADLQRVIISANAVLRMSRSVRDGRLEQGRWYYIPWDPAQNHTIVDFLEAANKNNISVPFTYVWWRSARYSYMIWPGISFLVLGLACPMLIRLMERRSKTASSPV